MLTAQWVEVCCVATSALPHTNAGTSTGRCGRIS